MALPYKLLKSVTIDGETMGLDPDIGQIIGVVKDRTAVGPKTYVTTDEITVSEDGLYLFSLEADFSIFTSTGNAVCSSTARVNGTNLYYSIFYTYGGSGNRHTTPYFVYLKAGDKLVGAAQSSVGCTIVLMLRVVKLLTVRTDS